MAQKSSLPNLQSEMSLEDSPTTRLALLLIDGDPFTVRCSKYSFAIGRSKRDGSVRYILSSAESEIDFQDGQIVVSNEATHLVVIQGEKSTVIPEVSKDLFAELASSKGIVWSGISAPPPAPKATKTPSSQY